MERLRKLVFFGTFLCAVVLFVVGCGNNDEKVVDGNKDKPLFTSELEDAEGLQLNGEGYGFDEFDLEIDVDGVETIDINFEAKENFEAEYVNKLQDFHLKENEAMDALHELFIHARITKETSEKDAIERVLEFLHIDHYSKFDLDINFNEGTILDINDEE